MVEMYVVEGGADAQAGLGTSALVVPGPKMNNPCPTSPRFRPW